MERNYHVFQNGRLAREQNSLLVRTDDDDRHPLPVENVGALYFHGQIDVNTRVLDFLGTHGITAHIFNWKEYYAGSYVPRRTLVSGNSMVEQAAHYLDTENRAVIARSIVQASAVEMRRNLTYYDNRGTELGDVIDRMDELSASIEQTENVEALLGIEGNLREAYYRSFSRILPEGRARQEGVQSTGQRGKLVDFVWQQSAVQFDAFGTPSNASRPDGELSARTR